MKTTIKTQDVTIFPSRTEIADAIEKALESSVELQEAIAELDQANNKQENLQTQLLKYGNQQAEFLRQKTLFDSGTFGDNEDDVEKLKQINLELASLDEAIQKLGNRLKPDGEIRRLIKDKTYHLEHVMRAALKPLQNRLESAANKQVDELVNMCEAYTLASFSAWPRKTPNGHSIRYSTDSRLLDKITISDGMRLKEYSPDISMSITGAMQAGFAQGQNVGQQNR